MKKNRPLLLVLALGIVMGYGQDRSKNAVFGSRGWGDSNGKLGINGSVGFQRQLWKDRLRIVPSISFGTYTAKPITGAPDAYSSSTNLKINLNFDILKMKNFSMFFGSGFVINYTSGLLGTGGEPGRTTSEYFNKTNIGLNGLLGLRLMPSQSRFGYELLLLDGTFPNTNKFSELSIKLRFIMKIFTP